MKKLKQILLPIIVLSFMVSSCSKDDNEPNVILEKASISAKWIVDSSSGYDSFEFNESGNYIVVKNTTAKSINNKNVFFGTYEIIDNVKIILSDFGTLTISEINENSLNFSFKLLSTPDNEIIMNASKEEEIESSTKTELLCRTWTMNSINGEDVVGTENELSVLFSKAGTYFVEFANPSEENDGGIAHWKWLEDNTESKFLYSWEDIPVWEEEGFVEIIELTNNSLKILEKFDSIGELYELVPKIN